MSETSRTASTISTPEPQARATRRRRKLKLAVLGGAVLALGIGTLASKYAASGGSWRVVSVDRAMAGDVKAVGDIDGDGFVDLVIGGMAGSENMVWYRYPDWTKFFVAAAKKEFTTDMQLADMDGDRDLDVVVADGDGADNVVWLENPRPKKPAKTANWARRTIGSHGGWVHDLELADFDGDGRRDVVTRKDATKIWFAGAAGAWTALDLSELVGRGEGLGIGDVDGDGDVDLVANCAWFENPADARSGQWRRHAICTPWDDALTAAVADFDRDGKPDVAITSQHKPLKLAIFSRPQGAAGGNWRERVIDEKAGGHKLNVGDFDLDGRLDLQTALEKQSVTLYLSAGSAKDFRKVRLPETGHNLRAGDIGNDGDLDLFGAEYTGNPPTRIWENRIADRPPAKGTLPKGRWTTQRITDQHERTFGLAFADVDRDGKLDIVSGGFWYRNEGRSADRWSRRALPSGMHACLSFDADGDADVDLIAQKNEGAIGVYLLERDPRAADAWSSTRIGELPRASHDLGTQGYLLADLEPGGRPEIVLTSGRGSYYFAAPEAGTGPWRRVAISEQSSDEGIAAADIDRDGRLDVVTTSGETKRVLIHLNPARPGEPWRTLEIARLPQAVYLDRVAALDLNRDGRVDVVVTEENGQQAGANSYWFEQPLDPFAAPWPRHAIVSQATTNSLDTGDVDGDGDQDLVLGEHRGALRLSLWENDGAGHFTQRILAAGVESHLGARLSDLDGDGDLDVVSIAWDEPRQITVLWNESK